MRGGGGSGVVGDSSACHVENCKLMFQKIDLAF